MIRMYREQVVITAPHAADWKAAVPSNKETSLSDTHYRIAARYNLGLAPPGVPSDCQGCKEKNKLNTDTIIISHAPDTRDKKLLLATIC